VFALFLIILTAILLNVLNGFEIIATEGGPPVVIPGTGHVKNLNPDIEQPYDCIFWSN
jgi:hypothetical protein